MSSAQVANKISGTQALVRLLTNACPRCSTRGIMRSMFQIHTHCSHCNLLIDRGNGFLLGAIPVSYFIVSIWISLMIALAVFGVISSYITWVSSIAFAIVFPVLFHAYTKLIWVGIYYAFLPKELNIPMDELEPPDHS